jgi:hypothetical protein
VTDAPPHGLDPNGDSYPNGDPNGYDPIDIAKVKRKEERCTREQERKREREKERKREREKGRREAKEKEHVII